MRAIGLGDYFAAGTHPDIAPLVDPLFAFGGKRVSLEDLSSRQTGNRSRWTHTSSHLVSVKGEERVVQRSVDQVGPRVKDCSGYRPRA
jgi:hypothetical protein